jgi:hypothetical protein
MAAILIVRRSAGTRPSNLDKIFILLHLFQEDSLLLGYLINTNCAVKVVGAN